MQQYSLGIAFDYDGNLALIKKTKPEWQAGKYNFIGGKLEENENILDCVSREFFEETGVMIPSYKWRYVGKMRRETDFQVFIFLTVNEDVKNIKTTTEEEVILVSIDKFELDKELEEQLLPNLKVMYEFIKSNDYIEKNAELIINFPKNDTTTKN